MLEKKVSEKQLNDVIISEKNIDVKWVKFPEEFAYVYAVKWDRKIYINSEYEGSDDLVIKSLDETTV